MAKRLNRDVRGKYLPIRVSMRKLGGVTGTLAETGVVRVIEGSLRSVPHTLVDKHGQKCRTDRWFNMAFLVFDPAGVVRLGLSGPGWRCYYPQSSGNDLASLLGSGSGGRWIDRWSEKSNYISF